MQLPCKDCVSGYVLPGEPKGVFAEGAYFSPNPDGSTTSSDQKTAIVLLTDNFGLQLKNPKILADSFAASLDCDVFVPDLFNGHPPLNEQDLAPYIPDSPGQRRGVIATIQWIILQARSIPALYWNRPSVAQERAEEFIRNIKDKKGYSQVGVVGYCFGAGIALAIATQANLAKAVVACHPGPVDIGNARTAVVPLAIFCSDEDEWLPVAKRTLAEVALRENSNTPSKLVVFPGTRHGFATRPNLGLPKVREGFEGAYEGTVAWLKKYLI